MKEIWHKPLPIESGPFTLQLPKGAIILYVGSRRDRPTLWFLCDANHTLEERKFYTAYSGANMESLEKMNYLGTVASSWSLVFHYFEEA